MFLDTHFLRKTVGAQSPELAERSRRRFRGSAHCRIRPTTQQPFVDNVRLQGKTMGVQIRRITRTLVRAGALVEDPEYPWLDQSADGCTHVCCTWTYECRGFSGIPSKLRRASASSVAKPKRRRRSEGCCQHAPKSPTTGNQRITSVRECGRRRKRLFQLKC